MSKSTLASSFFRLAVSGAAILATSGATSFAADAKKEDKVTYRDHVMPIFENNCLNCHNPDEAKGGLDLSTYGATLTGGSGGSIIDPENPDGSRLFTLMTHKEEPHMPPEKPVRPEAELEIIKKWILGGILEHDGSTAKKSDKPKLDMSLTNANSFKPEGAPPMPQHLLLEPEVVTDRPDTVVAMAHSPWAPIVAVGGQKQVLLFHSATGELLGVLPYPEGFPEVLNFSQNGSLLLCGGGRGGKNGNAVAWDVKTGQRVIEVGKEFDTVLGADISPDHRKVVLGGPGKNIKLWDTTTGEQTDTIKKHPDWMLTADFSPDGVLFATGGRNADLYVWEGPTGMEFWNLKGHTAAVTDISWRADSNVLASASEDGSIIMWEMKEGKQVKKWTAHAGGVMSVDFAPDGRLVSCGRDKTVKIWKADGNAERTINASDDIVMSAVFSNDSQRVISGDYNGKVKIWNAANGEELASIEVNPRPISEQIVYSEKRISELNGTFPKLQESIKVASTQTDSARSAMEEARKAAAAAAARQAEMEKELGAVKSQADQIAAAQKQAQQTLAAKQGELAKRTAAVQAASQAVQAAQAEMKKWQAELPKRQDAANKLAAALEAAKKAAAGAKVDEQLKKSLADATTAHQSVKSAHGQAQQQVNALKKKVQDAEAKAKAATEAKAANAAELVAAHKAAAQELKEADAQLAATSKRLSEVAAQLQPLQKAEADAVAKEKAAQAALAKQTADQQAGAKALKEAQDKLAAATKAIQTGEAQMKAAQDAEAVAKAELGKAQGLVAQQNKAMDDMKPKLAAAEKQAQNAASDADKMAKEKEAAEKNYQNMASKAAEAKKALDKAQQDLAWNEYRVKKYKAEALNLEAHQSSEALEQMEMELESAKQTATDALAAHQAAEKDLADAKATLQKAQKTIEDNEKALASKTTEVLETALKLAQEKAAKADQANADSISGQVAAMEERLGKLQSFIQQAYKEAADREKAIAEASEVAKTTPAVINERSKTEDQKEADRKKAEEVLKKHEAELAAQQKKIEELKAQYLAMLPKQESGDAEKAAAEEAKKQ